MDNIATMSIATTLDTFKSYLQRLQESICVQLEAVDGTATFGRDAWEREKGGYGITRCLEGGNVLERAGVNFSHVFGDGLPQSASSNRDQLSHAKFNATGISLVFHPRNPFVPTVHMNVRFFCATQPDGTELWWFGGGYDLTPYYLFEEDAVHWHSTAKRACDPFGPEVYQKYKQWCDKYFYLPHRNETRGVGGLFFDDVNQWPIEQCLAFTQAIGSSFLEAYLPILNRRKDTPFNEKHKAFQEYRRGRYVEFNLVYDRGTLFGLQTGGRTESILMSLPPMVQFAYNYQPEPGSEEAALYQYLKPKEWLD